MRRHHIVYRIFLQQLLVKQERTVISPKKKSGPTLNLKIKLQSNTIRSAKHIKNRDLTS